MDCSYALSFTQYVLHAANPVKLLSVAARLYSQDKDKRVDAAMNATFLFNNFNSRP